MRLPYGRSLAFGAVLAGLLCPATLVAQRDAECAKVVAAVSSRVPDNPDCHVLATIVLAELSDAQFVARLSSSAEDSLLTPRMLQPLTGEANISGVPGQSDAVPSAQPTALASANLSAVGTDNGTKTLAAISLNPATLFGKDDGTDAAKWSRVADLTLLVPTGEDGGPSTDLSYFGVRARLNITGLSAGDRLLEEVSKAFESVVVLEADFEDELERAFKALPDSASIADCVDAVLQSSYGDSPEECLGNVTLSLGDVAYDALQRSIMLARQKADARYLGLDLRYDNGDPTLAGDPAKEVTALQASLAFGRQSVGLNPMGTTFGLTGRIGARYSQLQSSSDSVVWSLDGALGFEANRLMADQQQVRLSAGLEFRYANKSAAVAEEHQTDNLVIRGAIAIPLVGGTSVTVAFTTPVQGEVSPALSVNFNWGLLMSNLPVKVEE